MTDVDFTIAWHGDTSEPFVVGWEDGDEEPAFGVDWHDPDGAPGDSDVTLPIGAEDVTIDLGGGDAPLSTALPAALTTLAGAIGDVGTAVSAEETARIAADGVLEAADSALAAADTALGVRIDDHNELTRAARSVGVLPWGKWLLVGSPGLYSTPDVGPFTGDGVDVRVRAIAFAEDPATVGTSTATFLECLTQIRQAPGGWGSDQDNHETALTVSYGEVGVFHEHCQTGTAAPVQAGEYAAGRIGTVVSAAGATVLDPEYVFRLGEACEFRIKQQFNVAGQWVKSIQGLAVGANQPYDDQTDDGRRWRTIVRRTGVDGPDSMADAGMPWEIGLHSGLLAIQSVEAYNGIDGTLVLHFDADDYDGTDVVSSEVSGQVWAPTGTPYLIDLTPENLALIGTAGGAVDHADVTTSGFSGNLEDLVTQQEVNDWVDALDLPAGAADDAPGEPLGAADNGVSGYFARADHVHPTTGLALSGHDHSGVYDPAGTAAAAVAALAPIPRVVVLTADRASTSEVLADTTGLSWSCASGTTYLFRLVLFVSGDTTGDVHFALTHPGGTLQVGHDGIASTASSLPANQTSAVITTASGSTIANPGTHSDGIVKHVLEGSYICTTNGTVQLQHRRRSAAGTTTVEAGSFLTYFTAT